MYVFYSFRYQLARPFVLDKGFCGDYIFLSSDYQTCGIDSSVQSWFSTRGKFHDNFVITRGVHSWEVTVDCTAYGYIAVGVCGEAQDRNSWIGSDSNGCGYYGDGTVWKNGASFQYGEKYYSGDVIGVTVDMEKKTIAFSKNGRSLGVACEIAINPLFPAFSFYTAFDRISVFPPKSKKKYPFADRSRVITLKTYKGNRVELDCARESHNAYNFYPGDKVRDSELGMDGVIVGIGIAPERFRGYIFVYHKERPGIGGWRREDVGIKLKLKEAASKSVVWI